MTNQHQIDLTLHEIYRQAHAATFEGKELEGEYIRLKNEAERIVCNLGGNWSAMCKDVCRLIHDLLEVRTVEQV